MTGNSWAAKKEWTYYNIAGDTIVVPRGMKTRLLKFLDTVGEGYEIEDDFVEKKLSDAIISTIKLRDYQVPIVEKAVNYSDGIIKMSTGSGKTIVACELIYRLGLTATILVNKTSLASQFAGELKKFYGIEAGMIGQGKKNIKQITIATVQTLQRDAQLLSSLAEQTSVLIVDECQSAVTDKTIEVLGAFKPKHLLGLTATDFRDDGKTAAIGFYFGGLLCDYKMEAMKPTIDVVRTGAEILVDDYHVMIENMVEHEGRNALIKALVIGEMLEGRRVLVLTKRVAHYKTIYESFDEDDNGVFFLDSKDKHRNDLLASMKCGLIDFKVLFGTTSLLSVGVDVPMLDTLIIACDMKGAVITTQSVGRITRLFEGKKTPKVIDLYDDKNPILKRQFWARKKVYDENGFKVNY